MTDYDAPEAPPMERRPVWSNEAEQSVLGALLVEPDAADRITLVTRGADLFAATHIHRLLQALLGLPVPQWHHHALLVEADGRKLAKRRGSPALADLRLAGEDGAALADSLRRGELPAGITFARSLHSAS